MDALQKSLLTLIAILLFLPIAQAEDKIYRVEGLPSNLHYSTGSTYEIILTANDYASISGVNITVTNGSLSLTTEFEADVHNLLLESSEEGWTFFWQAPSQSFGLGEGNSLMAIVFTDLDGEIWSSYESMLRSPEIVSHSSSGVPDWANSLAWAGVSITVLCSVAGSYVLRRDKIKE
tara:strand:+ start:755 stop:1285 length:531 start_codon:yes stop_codon:yes gene_type:complete